MDERGNWKKNKTQAEVDALVERRAETLRRTLASRTAEERASFSKTCSEAAKAYWNTISSESRAAFALRVREGVQPFYASADKEVLASRAQALFNISDADRRDAVDRAAVTRRAYYASLSLGERAERVKASFGSEESLRKRADHWASELPEERQRRLEASFLSPEAILESARSNSRGPSLPELFLGMKLEKYFPGVWAYNGSAEQGVVIERKVPDFVSRNGFKAVIEVFGNFYHNSDYRPLRLSEEELVELYERNGHRCLVVWEDDCFGLEIVERIRKWLAVEVV